MSAPVPIVQTLLLLDRDVSRELGPTLWAVLIEIERFYNFDQVLASFERHYISPFVPSQGFLQTAWQSFKSLGGRDVEEGALTSLKANQREQREISAAAGRYRRTYDQAKLGPMVKDILNLTRDSRPLLIVTDLEITPPDDWRYIIWDSIEGAAAEKGSVISVAPTDPKYWRQEDPNRLATIKRRVRVAGLAATGSMLKLTDCDNANCFLYECVDSVTTLDLMTHLGPEHGIAKLVGRGFAPVKTDPSVVQGVVPASDVEGQVTP